MAKQKMNGNGKRLITAWATTDDLDRSKDTIDPVGVKFDLPLPLLFAHDHSKPIGKVIDMKKIGNGWLATAELLSKGSSVIADETYAGIVQDALNGVSVGFLPVSSTKNAQGGIDYQEIALHELSVVAVPCNQKAVIIGVSDDTPTAPVSTPKTLSTPKQPITTEAKAKRAKVDELRAFVAEQEAARKAARAAQLANLLKP